jgi:hypothetical protein
MPPSALFTAEFLITRATRGRPLRWWRTSRRIWRAMSTCSCFGQSGITACCITSLSIFRCHCCGGSGKAPLHRSVGAQAVKASGPTSLSRAERHSTFTSTVPMESARFGDSTERFAIPSLNGICRFGNDRRNPFHNLPRPRCGYGHVIHTESTYETQASSNAAVWRDERSSSADRQSVLCALSQCNRTGRIQPRAQLR